MHGLLADVEIKVEEGVGYVKVKTEAIDHVEIEVKEELVDNAELNDECAGR